MDYILSGNGKDVANVIKEQRIRLGRGVISITPVNEAGIVTQEEARGMLEELAVKDAEIKELTAIVKEKEERISALNAENLKNAAFCSEDTKAANVSDLKEMPVVDSKDVLEEDKKTEKKIPK